MSNQKASPIGVSIGPGSLAGKGVYATRAFKKGDRVIKYNLQPLTSVECNALSEDEKMFVHSHYGKMYLYGVPERYVNHSDHPNTHPDIKKGCDVAIRDIANGDMITTDATLDDVA